MKRELTEAMIAELQPRRREDGKTVDLWVGDSGVPGLRIRASTSGSRVWQFAYRSRVTGKPDSIPLGMWPEVSLIEARTHAAELRRKLRMGLDPKDGRVKRGHTVGELFDSYITAHKDDHAPKTRSHYASARKWLEPILTNHVAGLRREDVEDMLAELKPGARWNAHKILGAVLRWAHGRYGTPVVTLAMKRRPLRPRDRVLSNGDIQSLLEAVKDEEPGIRLAVWLLLGTAQRVGEVLGATWAELSVAHVSPLCFDWSMKAARRKTREAHRVPLPANLCAVLLREVGVDPTNAMLGLQPTGSLTGMSAGKSAKGREQWPQRVCRKAVELGAEPFQFRDLRRTAATGIAEAGAPEDICRRILGHSAGRFSVTHVYQRHARLEEQRDALSRWFDRVELIAAHAQLVGFPDAANEQEPTESETGA